MTSLLGWRRRRGADLGARVSALQDAAVALTGRVPEPLLDRVADVVARAGQRTALGADRTVVALAGSTGSGKSSLFNAVVGFDLALTGVRRPTTAEPLACLWGADGSDDLLDWLAIPPVRRIARESELGPAPKNLRGLVLLDLPDHDSLVTGHRQEVDRLVQLVDLLVWVVDPQKYADAVLHEDYLRRMTAHGAVVVVVLNQVDRLSAEQRATCLDDLRGLLEQDGLVDVPVLAASATTGEGVDAVDRLLERAVRTRHTATERLAADVSALGWELATQAGLSDAVREAEEPLAGVTPGSAEEALVDAVAAAVGVDELAAVAAATQQRRAKDVTGWPGARWWRRLSPAASESAGEQVLALAVRDATPVVSARVDLAVQEYVQAATQGLPPGWVRRAGDAADPARGVLVDELVARTVQVAAAPVTAPRWWSVQRWLQVLAFGVAALGLVWVVTLLVLGVGRGSTPGAPALGSLPWPGVLLVSGVVGSLLLTLAARAVPARWAARVAADVRQRVREEVRATAGPTVVEPVREELVARDTAVRALIHAVG